MLENLTETFNLPRVRLQYDVAKLLGVSVFSDTILDMTYTQLLWTAERHIYKGEVEEGPEKVYDAYDPDFDSKLEEVLNASSKHQGDKVRDQS
jgi:hypothetical protein